MCPRLCGQSACLCQLYLYSYMCTHSHAHTLTCTSAGTPRWAVPAPFRAVPATMQHIVLRPGGQDQSHLWGCTHHVPSAMGCSCVGHKHPTVQSGPGAGQWGARSSHLQPGPGTRGWCCPHTHMPCTLCRWTDGWWDPSGHPSLPCWSQPPSVQPLGPWPWRRRWTQELPAAAGGCG